MATTNVFDFGFTLVDEDDLEVSQKLESSATETSTLKADVTATQDKCDDLYNAIMPLLGNLKANPEKEYILWPNRVEKVEQFETHLQSIYNK